MTLEVETRYKTPVATAAAFGRVFYASGNKVYFSQVIESSKQVGKCYQNNDPTSEDYSDLLPTDGGLIPLEGAVNIKRVVPFRTGVLCFAENGVWHVAGTSSNFDATGYSISKITSFGIRFTRSVVNIGPAVFYGGDSGIIAISANEFDSVVSQIITDTTIKSKYLEIFGEAENTQVWGEYNDRDKSVWWFNSATGDGVVLNTTMGAFYPQHIESRNLVGAYSLPKQDKLVFLSSYDESNIHYYAFSTESSYSFKDWDFDIDAYMVGGPETLGQFSYKKGATNIVMHFKRTEQIVSDDGDGGYEYDYPSSCLLSVIAGSSSYSGHQSQQQQMYRLNRRGWIPEELPIDLTEQGDDIVVTKDKIRAKGTSLKVRIDTESGKDCHLLGYSIEYSMRGRQ